MLAVGGSAWIRLCPRFPEAHRARFNEAAVGYLEHRTNLCLVFALIDSSLAPQKIDLEFVEWLVHECDRKALGSLALTVVDNRNDYVCLALIRREMDCLGDGLVIHARKSRVVGCCILEGNRIVSAASTHQDQIRIGSVFVDN